ncbi:GNAT family N-acetyltransferase [Methylobacterium isbiliense]|jgi:predicted GNAT family acetyltransferase|uniref:N-acetyltransferase domain-containing protein n=1 Tax=Methylobacterium isbiliense TaxID=315478 RepID=A0ABQ4S9E9_9HYPH|nr:GNAT family N-acetyltransferase [Methylobacterium isbiliense]MDN3623225.1 GNAT family N-acetyltransferase [Methylobacterium isbiliense]GJD98295.1 hypothetical protein GMJLKIPL_0202 [Methylobacterium isbiliense]
MHDNVERSRFELPVGDAVVYADYRRQDRVLAILYVYAPPALRGTGAAGRLMADVAAHARAEGLTVRPLCGYARSWLRSHGSDVLG